MPRGAMPPMQPSAADILQGAFTSGELAPNVRARSDISQYHSGAETIRNFFVHPTGGVMNRSGTQYVGVAKFPTTPIRLIPFERSVDQTYVLEFGQEYVRFIQAGSYLVNADGSVYEVATPYAATDLALLKCAQVDDVLTLVHTSYPPYELRRFGQTSWEMVTINFATSLATPSGVGVADFNSASAIAAAKVTLPVLDYVYAVTAVSTSPPDESLQSGDATCQNYDTGYYGQYGVYNTISWSAVPNAVEYNVYRYYNGVYAFIGTTAALTFQDQGVLPDVDTGPPAHVDPFANGNYPATVSFTQGRRVFGGAANAPQTLYMSKSGNYYSMDVSVPPQADDAITATIAAQNANPIQQMIAVQDLIALTLGGAFKISGGSASDVITPSAVVVQPQVFNGCSNLVRSIVVGLDILYVEAKGSAIRDLAYNLYASVYTGADVSLLSNHLFLGYSITDWAWAQEPYKVMWMVRSDGVLVGLTYLKEQEIQAFHRHDTVSGTFQNVCVVSETTAYGALEDVLYVAVERVLNGVTQTYLERMHTRQLGGANNDVTQAWFVDCGLQYDGAPTSVVTGLSYLENCTVAVLADGSVLDQQVVTNGQVTLPQPASIVTVGLPIQAQLVTMPLDVGEPTVQGKRKRVSRIRLLLQNTRGLKAACLNPTSSKPPFLQEFKERTTEAPGNATLMSQGQEFLDTRGNWDVFGTVLIQQDNPLPAAILGVEPEFEIGS